MKYDLYSKVALANDIEGTIFKKGDIGTVVEYLEPPEKNAQPGYCLEMFDAYSNTVDVIVVPESSIITIPKNSLITYREYELA